MTLHRAHEVLKEYNEWRRHEGEPEPCKYSGLEIGAAIDIAVYCLWKLEKISEIIQFDGGESLQ